MRARFPTVVAAVVCAAALLSARGVRAETSSSESAQAQFDRGAKLYNLGHFQDAIANFEKAYDLDPSPIFLFNIAQSHRQLGNKERALFFYRRYLEQAPNAVNRDDVERRMHELQAALQQEAESQTKPPTGVAPPVETRPATVTAPPPSGADDQRPPATAPERLLQVLVGLGPAFPAVSSPPGQKPDVPSMFAARLELAYAFELPAGRLAVAADLGYAHLPYRTLASMGEPMGTGATSQFWSTLLAVRYLFAVVPAFRLGAGVEGGYMFWAGLGKDNPFTVNGVAASGAIAMPSFGVHLRAEVTVFEGLFVAVTPELLWSSLTSSSGNGFAITGLRRFDLMFGAGYAF